MNGVSVSTIWQALEVWQQQGWLRALDINFGRYLQRQLGDSEQSLQVAVLATLVSHKLGQGHPCLKLAELRRNPDAYLHILPEHLRLNPQALDQSLAAFLPDQIFAQQEPMQWLETLQQSVVCKGEQSPLVVVEDAIYLRRMWNYEQGISVDLQRRMTQQVPITAPQVAEHLTALFGPPQAPQVSWQRLACAMAVKSGFSMITGGPGTGKTYTVVRLLALLQALHTGAQPLRIRLAAPTGKAAARMTESIAAERANLPNNYQQLLNTGAATELTAVTLHRLLGSQPGTREFVHHRQHQLAVDVLIVDEASMIDIEMMAAMCAALPSKARLILLGDKDQLASVEAGAVLGQLCAGADAGGYQPATANWLEQATGEAIPANYIATTDTVAPYLQHTVMLRESRRFDAEKGIGKLAFEINQQQTTWLKSWLADPAQATQANPSLANIALLQPQTAVANEFYQFVKAGLQPLQQSLAERPEPSATDIEFAEWAARVLRQLGQFQLLTAVREGEWGMQGLNQMLESWFRPSTNSRERWYHGRPVMMTHNDYQLDLRNGDIGIALATRPDEPLRVAFPALGESTELPVRWLMPSRLNQVETVYAMTVHKSQGSEFVHTALVLPAHDSPILTKELLYTGVTRAREQFTLIAAQPKLVLKATQRRVERYGGL